MPEALHALLGALAASALAALWLARARAADARARAQAEEGHADALARLRRAHAAELKRLAAEAARLRTELAAEPELPAADGPSVALDPSPRLLAQAVGQTLATIVSGIEGSMFRLIESAPQLRAETDGIEALWLGVRRLRRFHDKMTRYARQPERSSGQTSVERLLHSLREELSSSALGLQITCKMPVNRALLAGELDELLVALTLVLTALHQLEHGALRLQIRAEPCFAQDDAHMQIELCLERNEETRVGPQSATPTPMFLIARAAAQNLVRAHGGTLTITHEAGHEARALLRLPLAADETRPSAAQPVATPVAATPVAATPAAEPTVVLPRTHSYGGVLLIENDAAVRSMLAAEFKAQGRAVCACADGAAARSLIQATPERFEILVVDEAARLADTDLLASTAARMCPELRVFVLSDLHLDLLPQALAPRVLSIRKPFGVHELRRALSAALTAESGARPL